MGKSLLVATGIVALFAVYVLGIYFLAKIIGLWVFAILAVIFIIVIAFGINSIK